MLERKVQEVGLLVYHVRRECKKGCYLGAAVVMCYV